MDILLLNDALILLNLKKNIFKTNLTIVLDTKNVSKKYIDLPTLFFT